MSFFDEIVVTHIDHVFMIPSSKGRFMEMERRVDFGLSFCGDGQITYTQQGEKIVSDRFHAVILPQGGCYTLQGDEAGVPLVNFRATEQFTDKLLSIKIDNPEVYIKDVERISELLSLGDKAKAFSVLYRIFDRLKNEGQEKDFLLPAVRFMNENIHMENLSNTVIAAKLNISEVWLRKQFKNRYGISPHKYLVNLRIERAKQLLSGSRMTVTEVAEKCGFSGVYHFCKTFRDKVGITPTDFRKNLENLEI